MTRKLPRLINIFGPDDPKPAPMSRRRRAAIAADAKPVQQSCYGEPMAIDRSAISYHPRSASGPLAEDGKPYPLVQGETHRIAD